MASGDTLCVFMPTMNEPPTSSPATLDWRNRHPVLDFDTAADEYAIFSAVMPQAYGGATGVTVYVHYSMSTATTGTCAWQVEFERIGDQQQDIDTDGWGGAGPNNIAAVTVPGTSGNVDIVNTTFTDGADMDSVAAGEKFRIRVNRDVSADTAADDAELHAVEIRET